MTAALRSELSLIAQTYDIKIRFRKQKTTSGLAFLESEIIWISPEIELRDEALSILFHEICHIICYRNKIFWNYHNPVSPNEKKAKIALRAERFVDKMAKNKLKKYDPDCMFFESYIDPDSAQWMRDYYLK